MERTEGRPEVTIGLLDGPVAEDHPDLEGQDIRQLPGAGGDLLAEAVHAADQP